MTGVCTSHVRTAPETIRARLHQARFRVPATRRAPLARRKVLQRLHSTIEPVGANGAVTVVTAPAGSGKTALLASLARELAPRDVAWCTIDACDNDPQEFGHSVLESVLAARSPEGVGRAAGTHRAATDSLDEALLIARAGDPIVLLLDECEHVRIGPMHGTLERLIRQAPANMSIVCSTSQDLQLSTSCTKRISSIRAADLRLSTEEVCDLFQFERFTLAPEVAGALNEFAQGSVGTLRLAAVAYADARDRERVVSSALRRDTSAHAVFFELVYDRMTPEQRTLIRSASVNDIVCRELATATSGLDSAHLFDTLRSFDLFFEPIPGCAGWFKHRHPSRELAMAELLHESGHELELFSARAARWFAANGQEDRALERALRGNDWQLVVELVSRRWLTAALDGLNPGLGALPSPPDALATHDRETALAACAIDLERGDHDAARSRLDAIERTASEPTNAPSQFELLLRLHLARTASAPSGIRDASQALLHWSRTQPTTVAVAAESLGERGLAEAMLIEGDVEQAAILLEDACTEAVVNGCDQHVTLATSMLAVVTALEGRPRRASALVDELMDPCVSGSDFACGLRALARAICEYHADNLPLAQIAAGEARSTLRRGVFSDLLLTMVRARIAASVGDSVGAGRLMTRAAGTGNRRLLQLTNEALGLSPLADTGLAGEAVPDRDEVHPYTAARTALSAAARSFDVADHERAWFDLERALVLVERNAYRRLFLDAGLHIAPLLRDYIAQARPFDQVAWQILQRVPRERDASAPPTVETLTERELAVLRHLPLMKSNRDIAAEMYFSVNTVKTHLKSIYRKLGVNQRRDAVEEARARSIL